MLQRRLGKEQINSKARPHQGQCNDPVQFPGILSPALVHGNHPYNDRGESYNDQNNLKGIEIIISAKIEPPKIAKNITSVPSFFLCNCSSNKT